MTTWFVSRHPGALHWMERNNIAFDKHVDHLDPSLIQKDDIVIGSLPINLAAQVCAQGAEYWHLSLQLPPSARGRELSAEELDLYEARLEHFVVRKV